MLKTNMLFMFLSPDDFPPRQMAANRLIWMSLVIACGLIVTISSFLDIAIQINYKPLFIYLFTVCALTAGIYRYIRQEKAIFMLGESIAQLLIASFVILSLAALGARIPIPLADQALYDLDQFIGFDWHNYAALLAIKDSWTYGVFKFCYQSYGAQLSILLPMIFFYQHSDYGQRAVMMFLVAGIGAAILSTLMPAEGVYTYLHLDPNALEQTPPSAPLVHHKSFHDMRDATSNIIYYPAIAMGTFPSMHAILAIMLIYISVPLTRLRWCVIPFNIMMIIATPYHGGHYLTDVIAGIILAFIGIYVAESILPPRSEASSTILNQLGTHARTQPPLSS